MISRDKYKKALGDKVIKFSEEEIEKAMILQDKLADLLFDFWLGEKKNKINKI